MQVELSVEDCLVHGETPAELKQKIRTGLIVFEYLREELSLGEVAELMDMDYETTMDWLNSIGVHTSRLMSSSMEAESNQNMLRLLGKLQS